jgi:hypothetical protein
LLRDVEYDPIVRTTLEGSAKREDLLDGSGTDIRLSKFRTSQAVIANAYMSLCFVGSHASDSATE